MENKYIFLIYLLMNKIELLFCYLCGNGELGKAKQLYEKENIDMHFRFNQAFYKSCRSNHIEVVIWFRKN